MKKEIKDFLSILDGEARCEYCKRESVCQGGVSNYGNGPIFPYCADAEPEDYIDIDLVEEALGLERAGD